MNKYESLLAKKGVVLGDAGASQGTLGGQQRESVPQSIPAQAVSRHGDAAEPQGVDSDDEERPGEVAPCSSAIQEQVGRENSAYLQVREPRRAIHPRTLPDAPCRSSKVPVTIAWALNRTRSTEIRTQQMGTQTLSRICSSTSTRGRCRAGAWLLLISFELPFRCSVSQFRNYCTF